MRGAPALRAASRSPAAAKTTPPKVSGTATLKANVNVRKTASKSGEILETAKIGTSFKVLTNVGSWYQVEHAGSTAFITTIAEYVDFKPTAAPKATPNAAPKTDGKAQPEADSGGSWLDSAWSAATELVDTAVDVASEAASTVVDAVAAFFDGTPEEQKQSEGDLGKSDPGQTKTVADAGQTAGADTSPSAPSGSLLFKDPFEIVDGAAKLRDATATHKDTGKVIAKGTKVYVVKAEKTYVQIVTSPDIAAKIVEGDQVWTAFSNLGGTGADVGLGNEKSDDADKTKADDLRAGLPSGRKPGASPFKWQFSGYFQPSLEGKALEGTLMAKVQRLMEWAVENDMVTGDIVIGDGMRGPKTAHKMCVSWNIQYRWGTIIKLDALKALPGGKDTDGTTWYQDGWTEAQIKENAYNIRSSSKIAAAGHEPGDADRLPLPLNGKPGVSRHCTGRAVDVTIPWRAPGKDALTNGTDVWAWEDVYKQFGLHRPLHKSLVSDGNLQENWHIEETGKKLDGDDETDG